MEGKETVTFGEIIHHMITDAWYMVSEYHLNLGYWTRWEKLVREIQADSGLTSVAEPRKIYAFLETLENEADTKKMKWHKAESV